MADTPKLLCKVCEKELPKPTDYKCEDCGCMICFNCEERTDYISWFETTVEEPDKYLCKKCIKRRRKAEKLHLPA